MQLYSYDHCPFCMRVRLMMSFRAVDYEHIILSNDDEDTPISLTGKKMLPILRKPNGDIINESLDIIAYLDEYTGGGFDNSVRPQVAEWQEKVVAYYNHLVMPRIIKIGLQEFQTQSAIDYFVNKKTDYIGDFAENFANSEQYLIKINADLQALVPLMTATEYLQGQASMEDILVFPVLRNLSVVKGINWPTVVQDYAQHLAELSAMPLFSAQAL